MLLENVSLSITSLLANKMRAFLTMLGIMIGIASVVAIMTVSDAMNKSVMSSMGDMGANDISVYITQKILSSDSDSDVRTMKNSDYISDQMIQDIEEHFGSQISGVALSQSIGTYKIEKNKAYANIELMGANDTQIKKKKLKLITGRTFTTQDFQNQKKVVLVSDKYVNNMFGGDTKVAIGNTMEVVIGNKYYTYTIIGIYKYEDGSSEMGSGTAEKDMQTTCYMPLQTAMNQLKKDNVYDEFDVVAATGADSTSLAENIANYINQRYYKDNDTYEIDAYSMESEIEYMKSMLKTQKMAFLAIGALSLLVGGIGVMNIMIVSITERTREIGTRKALGATNGLIRLQFITEAIVVCVIGGILGIIIGCASGAGISIVMGYAGSPSVIGIVGSFFFSVIFGAFFGFYPADKAAKMNPIEALRYE